MINPLFDKHFFDILKCEKCNRVLPNKKFIIKNGCIWCDSEYYLKGEKDGQQKKKTFI